MTTEHASSAEAAAYREVLGRYGEVVDFDISGLDRLGVPITSCSLIVDGRAAQHGNGYGETDEQAELSGLGELAEGVLSAQTVAGLAERAERRSRAEMITRYGPGQVIDPRLLALPAGTDYHDDRPSDWVDVERLDSGEPVWVPIEFLASDPSEVTGSPVMITPVTNGLGAGLDRGRAISHGLNEIVQRHTNGLQFRALDRCSPVIEPVGLPVAVRGLIDRFAALGVEVLLKHAASELGAFSCYAMGRDAAPESPIMVTACGEAADPVPERSMIKAVLEYANSRARKTFCFGDRSRAEQLAPPEYWNALPSRPVGERRAVAAMQSWAALGRDELRRLTGPRTKRRVSVAEVSRPSEEPVDAFGLVTRIGEVWVAKTMVPGLEVETLSYGRIGERGARTALELDLDLVRIQDGPSESHHDRVSLTADAQQRLGGPVWYSYRRAEEIVGDLYPLYREPPRHSVELRNSAEIKGKGSACDC